MKVGVFYSQGPHLAVAIEIAQTRWPEAEVVVIPHAGEISEGERYTVATKPPHGAIATIQYLRSLRLDAIVVMFPSPRLQLLASASGARERIVCMPDGSLVPIEGNALTIAYRWIARRIHGELTYHIMRANVAMTKVKK